MENRPQHDDSSTGGLRGRTLLVATAAFGCCLLIGWFWLFGDRGPNGNAEAAASSWSLEEIPFNGTRAYAYLEQICALGRRPSGSPGMQAQQKLLTEHFTSLGGKVRLQSFRTRHPVDGSPVAMANLIVEWNPEAKERILLCTHYDTLPYPMLDREDPKGTFVGANDGGSGVALLMELGHEMPTLDTKYGVDFVFFDAEEFIFDRYDRYFIGSEYFARRHVRDRPPYRYRCGVLLDMIGDADLQLYQERNSMALREPRAVMESIWATARRLGVNEFIARKKHEVNDDHVPLNQIARIPTCDIIDFDYPVWHTRADTPDQCSALSLAKVGWVMREWLKSVR